MNVGERLKKNEPRIGKCCKPTSSHGILLASQLKGKKDLTLNCVSHQMLKTILLVSEIRIFKAGVLSALPNPSSEKTPNLGLFCIQFPKLGGEFTEFAAAVIKNPATNLTQKFSNIAVPRWQRNILKCI